MVLRCPRSLLLAGLAGVALASAPATRAQPRSSETPSRSLGPYVRTEHVSITNLDVVVTDSKGARVTGLKKDDFQIIEDGLEQTVTNFYAVEQGRVSFLNDEPVAAATPQAGTPAEVAPAPPPVPAPKTRMVIFIDNLHIEPGNRNRVLRNVEAFVRESVKGDVEAMIVTWNRSLKVRRKFTNDGRDLSDILKQIEEESALGTTTASERRDVLQAIDDSKTPDTAVAKVRQFALSQKNDLDFTIDALKTTVNQLAGVEGRKIMIHVSDGLAQSPGAELWIYIQDKFGSNATGMSTQNFEFDKTTGYLGVIQAANAAGVTIYTIDAKGLEVDSTVTAESRTHSQRVDTFTEQSNLQSMLSLMAEETGGKAILNRNDVTLPLKEIEKDTTSYYSLGYRSLRSGVDRPHKVDVKVKRKGLIVRARRSYLEKSVETKVREAVMSALFFVRDDNPLGAGIEVGKPVPADRQNYFVPITIRIPFARLTMLPEGNMVRGRVVFYFVVIDSAGKQSELTSQPTPIEIDAKRFQELAKRDFVYTVRLLMIPGGQKLSFAVRDDINNTTSYLQKSIFVSAFAGEEQAPATK